MKGKKKVARILQVLPWNSLRAQINSSLVLLFMAKSRQATHTQLGLNMKDLFQQNHDTASEKINKLKKIIFKMTSVCFEQCLVFYSNAKLNT